MLYFSTIDFNGPKNVALVFRDVNEDGKVNYARTKNILTNVDLGTYICEQGSLFDIEEANGHPLPIVKPTTKNVNVTALYNLLYPRLGVNCTVETFVPVAESINKQTEFKISAEDIYQIFIAMKELLAYMKEPVSININVADNLVPDLKVRQLIENINNNLINLSYIRNKDNYTVKMKSAKDLVRIQLPSYEECVFFASDTDSMEDAGVIRIAKDSFMPPYPRRELSTVRFREYLDRGYDIRNVVGSPENNKPGLYENEKDLYNRICELIKVGIEQEFPDKDLKQCEEFKVSSPVVRNYLKAMASQVARFGWSHCPALPLAVDEEVDDDDDNGSDDGLGVYKQITGNNLIKDRRAGAEGVSGDLSLGGFIENACKHNIYNIAEIIVKLLRWGERKPNYLELDGMPIRFNLNTFKPEGIVASLDACELVKVNGATYTYVQPVEFSGSFRDSKYLSNLGLDVNRFNNMSVPIGAYLIEYYKQPNKQNMIIRKVFASMIDIVEMLNNDPKCINGISLDSAGNIVTRTPDLQSLGLQPREIAELKSLENVTGAINKVNEDKDSYAILVVSREIEKLGLKLQQNYTNLGYLKVMYLFMTSSNTNTELGTNYCISREDFLEKSAGSMYAAQVLNATIGANCMPQVCNILQKSSMQLDSTGDLSIDDVLNIASVELTRNPIDLSLEDDEEDKSLEQTKMDKTASKLESMMLGGKQEDGGDLGMASAVLDLASALGEHILTDIKPEEILIPVTIKTKNNEPAGYVVQRIDKDTKKKEFVFARLDVQTGKKLYPEEGLRELCAKQIELAANKKQLTMKFVGLDGIVKVMCTDYYYLISGKPENTTLRFTDLQTAAHFAQILRSAKVTL
ncbi:hypothetical protein UT300012_23310 [Paraclostridium bifermentans]